MEAQENDRSQSNSIASPEKQEEENQFDQIRESSESMTVMNEINPFL